MAIKWCNSETFLIRNEEDENEIVARGYISTQDGDIRVTNEGWLSVQNAAEFGLGLITLSQIQLAENQNKTGFPLGNGNSGDS